MRPASRLRRVLLAGHRFDFDAPDRGVSGAALDARNLFRRNARREARAEQAQRPALFVGVRDFPRRAADDRRGVIRRQARLVDRGAVHEERADLRVLPEQLGLEALGGGVVVQAVAVAHEVQGDGVRRAVGRAHRERAEGAAVDRFEGRLAAHRAVRPAHFGVVHGLKPLS